MSSGVITRSMPSLGNDDNTQKQCVVIQCLDTDNEIRPKSAALRRPKMQVAHLYLRKACFSAKYRKPPPEQPNANETVLKQASTSSIDISYTGRDYSDKTRERLYELYDRYDDCDYELNAKPEEHKVEPHKEDSDDVSRVEKQEPKRKDNYVWKPPPPTIMPQYVTKPRDMSRDNTTSRSTPQDRFTHIGLSHLPAYCASYDDSSEDLQEDKPRAESARKPRRRRLKTVRELVPWSNNFNKHKAKHK